MRCLLSSNIFEEHLEVLTETLWSEKINFKNCVERVFATFTFVFGKNFFYIQRISLSKIYFQTRQLRSFINYHHFTWNVIRIPEKLWNLLRFKIFFLRLCYCDTDFLQKLWNENSRDGDIFSAHRHVHAKQKKKEKLYFIISTIVMMSKV